MPFVSMRSYKTQSFICMDLKNMQIIVINLNLFIFLFSTVFLRCIYFAVGVSRLLFISAKWHEHIAFCPSSPQTTSARWPPTQICCEDNPYAKGVHFWE